jgi:hypothetical protein
VDGVGFDGCHCVCLLLFLLLFLARLDSTHRGSMKGGKYELGSGGIRFYESGVEVMMK